MDLFFTKVPSFLQSLIPGIIWKGDGSLPGKNIFLTFDDGPGIKSTPCIMEILSDFNAKATFFLTGSRMKKNNELVTELKGRGHYIANHGYEHKSGFRISLEEFNENMAIGQELTGSGFFRPPFGHMTFRQYNAIKKKTRIVYWSVMPGDFVRRIDSCLVSRRIKSCSKNGDVIVLHDMDRMISKIETYLPEVLEYFIKEGYSFKTIDEMADLKTDQTVII